jgi:hypothetical protein
MLLMLQLLLLESPAKDTTTGPVDSGSFTLEVLAHEGNGAIGAPVFSAASRRRESVEGFFGGRRKSGNKRRKGGGSTIEPSSAEHQPRRSGLHRAPPSCWRVTERR